MNRLERFTKRAQRALSLAQEATVNLQHSAIDTEHLLLGLMQEEAGVAGTVLRELGLNRKQVEELVKELSAASQAGSHSPHLSSGVKRALEKAVAQANKLGHHYVGTEHLLLGLLEQKNSTAMTILDRLGITAQQVRQYTMTKLEHTEDDEPRPLGIPMADERRKVLDMVDEGKITALEGAELLKNLQVAVITFPFATIAPQLPITTSPMFRVAGSTPIEKIQNRILRMVVRKGDETQFELRHPMRLLHMDYMIFLQRFYSGELGKIMDVKADDKTIDLYIDEGEDEENEDEA
jgi:hypothetical protein